MCPLHEKQEFDRALQEAINEALTAVGEPCKKILLFHVQKNYKLQSSDISSRPEVFVFALKQVLGSGGDLIGLLVVKLLCKKLGFDYEVVKSLHFEEAITRISRDFDKT
jgi:hypothetical protein